MFKLISYLDIQKATYNLVVILTMVDDTKFWISCQQLKILRNSSRFNLIQNLASSTMVWRQRDIQIVISFLDIQIINQFEHIVDTYYK